MRSSSGDSWPGRARNRLVVLLFVSAEDRIRQVEECGRSGCQYEFSVPWLHTAVYELFVEPAMTKEYASHQTPPPALLIFARRMMWKHPYSGCYVYPASICTAVHTLTHIYAFDMWRETFDSPFLVEMGKCLSALCKLSADTRRKSLACLKRRVGYLSCVIDCARWSLCTLHKLV